MRTGIAVGVVVLMLTAGSALAQGRGVQIVTGAGLASLGVYAAVADRDCDNHPQTTLQNGRCEWRNSRGRLVGEQPDLSAAQVAGGLAVAGIGGLMTGGMWEPSRTIDSILTAGAGALLLTVARHDNYPRGTVHVEASDRRFTLCQIGDTTWSSDHAPEAADLCEATSFRANGMWTGIAALGLAAGRWLWRDESGSRVNIEARPDGIRVSKMIAF